MSHIPQIPGSSRLPSIRPVQVYEGEYENWSKGRPATVGEKIAFLCAVFVCCLLMAAVVVGMLSPAKALATMLLPTGAMLAYIFLRPGRHLRPAYRWALVVGFAAFAGLLMQVHILSELCFVGLGLDLLVITFMEKRGMAYE